MDWKHAALVAASAVGAYGFCRYAHGFFCAWRDDHRRRHHRPRQFVFRPFDQLGPNYAGGDNAWQGCLVTDGLITAEEAEILRAAVERYRALNWGPPPEGAKFEIVQGELVRVWL